MRKEIHQSKCEEWEKLIDQWIGSGLSKKQWCNENNINVRQLRYWQRVLKREVTGQNDSDNSGGQGCDANEPVDTASHVSPSGGFYEMPSSRQPNSKHRVISDDCENECLHPELVIRRSGYCIEINAGVSRNTLELVLAVLADA